MARSLPASSSGTALAAVMAPTSALPATTSATASSAVSNTRMAGAGCRRRAWRTTLATATWLELPSEVESATVTAPALHAKRCSRSAPLRIGAIGADDKGDVLGIEDRERRKTVPGRTW